MFALVWVLKFGLNQHYDHERMHLGRDTDFVDIVALRKVAKKWLLLKIGVKKSNTFMEG